MPSYNESQLAAAGLLALGIPVEKASATLPATTTQNIFVISGGRVLVTVLLGEVTTVIQTQGCNFKATSVPTVGTAADIAANLAISALEAGTLLVVEGDGTAMIGVSAGFAPALNALPFVLPIGTVRVETSATNTGATKWKMYYWPIDDGARVVSA